MAVTIAAPPLQTSLVDASGLSTPNPAFFMTSVWYRWLLDSLINRVQNTAQVLKVVSLSDQNASIATTDIPVTSLAAGLYRVQYYAAITTAAVTSSSLTVTFGWANATVTKSAAGAPITGNLTTTIQTNTLLLNVDSGTPITYATTYASNGAGEMRYQLGIVLEGPFTV